MSKTEKRHAGETAETGGARATAGNVRNMGAARYARCVAAMRDYWRGRTERQERETRRGDLCLAAVLAVYVVLVALKLGV